MRGTSNTKSVFGRTLCATMVAVALMAGCSGGGESASNTGPSGAPPVVPPTGSSPPTGGTPPGSGTGTGTPTAPPANLPPPPGMSGSFSTGVSLMDNGATLAKAATMFAGRNPTAAELAAASANEQALRTTIRSFLQGPTFDRFLDETGMSVFLVNRVVARGNNRGLSNNDFPMLANVGNSGGAFDTAVRREPIELLKYVVKNDKSWKDMVQGDYTVVNPVMAQFMGAQVLEPFANATDNNEWRPARVPERLGGMREHAGVLSTQAWLDSFPTTPTNRNRHRVNMLAKQFLATDVTALAARPIEDGRTFIVPTVENPGCAVCHDVIDPIAAGWQNWAETNRYLPNMVNNVPTALPASYRNTSYPNDAAGMEFYKQGDNWFRDGKAPGYGGIAMPGGVTGSRTALQWIGQQVAGDARFALGGVYFWYEAVFGRAPLKAPTDPTSPQYAGRRAAYNAQQTELDAIAARFAMTYNVKELIVDLVMSNWFRAEGVTGMSSGRAAELFDLGSVNLLVPTMLNAKLQATTGTTFNGFNVTTGNNLPINYGNGAALNFGDFDGNTRTQRAKEYTMMQTTIMDGLTASMSCGIVQADFGRAAGSRMLFPSVALTDTPATPQGLAAITANARYLHNWLLKENLPADHPEVQRTVKLFTDVWNDRATAPTRPVNCGLTAGNDANYTGRAWAAVVAYMIGDAKFLFE